MLYELKNGFTPQWGRSTVLTAPWSTQVQQLVRLQFEQAVDVTLYLQPMRAVAAGVIVVEYEIAAGIGGISIFGQKLPCSVVGTVLHFTCDTLDVNAQLVGSAGFGPPAVGSKYRVAACAGVGRPNIATELGGSVSASAGAPDQNKTPNDYGMVNLAAVGHRWIRCPMWSYEAKLDVANFALLTAADLTVSQVKADGTIISTSPMADYFGDYRSIDTYCYFLHLQNAGAVVAQVQQTFHKQT